MALNRKIAYIDLSTGQVEVKPIPLDVRKKFLGGRGLDAYLLYNHTEKGCDPLGPGNALIISGGILTATCASATARTHIMAKSPLTGLLGSANMGGFFAPELAWAGFHHLVITGKAAAPVYLFLHNNTVEIRDAGHLWGRMTTPKVWRRGVLLWRRAALRGECEVRARPVRCEESAHALYRQVHGALAIMWVRPLTEAQVAVRVPAADDRWCPVREDRSFQCEL
ncbi:MAG: aldehyde ferredoxin oxidoreductase N-terminal domain-containing protein [Deltaproteobacteria bacterium]|nr:aldehyde ferredoxin oxidoreductase N-terminal domain-containing protein [Deltaproteobacteria bacterium]